MLGLSTCTVQCAKGVQVVHGGCNVNKEHLAW